MSTYKISQLRDLFNDWETGLDQAVTLLPLFPIDVINEYWSLGWMQNPANPDDRWKSDWIRAILMAFSAEGSLPYEAKKQDRIRHKKEKSYHDTIDKFGLLTLTSDWNHLSSKLLHDLINNLGVTQLDFKCTELFENYLKNPAEVTEINVYISKEWNDTTTKIKDTDLAKTISERIPRDIENLFLSIEDNYKINFSENALSELKNKSDYQNLLVNLDRYQINFTELSKNDTLYSYIV
jgi:hypothetical protein